MSSSDRPPMRTHHDLAPGRFSRWTKRVDGSVYDLHRIKDCFYIRFKDFGSVSRHPGSTKTAWTVQISGIPNLPQGLSFQDNPYSFDRAARHEAHAIEIFSVAPESEVEISEFTGLSEEQLETIKRWKAEYREGVDFHCDEIALEAADPSSKESHTLDNRTLSLAFPGAAKGTKARDK